jgi:hypothetical protein
MFFLVSGSAASCKTTIAKNLPNYIKNTECHDLDEKVARTRGERCSQLEEWIIDAIKIQDSGIDFLLTSHSPLGELLACKSAIYLHGISSCLVDCSDHIRITRMRQRGIDPNWPPNQDVLSWASWHRMHAWDPQWEQHVIVDNDVEHFYNRWKNWQQYDHRWNTKIIDTTDNTDEKTMYLLKEWISEERKKENQLSNIKKWWK